MGTWVDWILQDLESITGCPLDDGYLLVARGSIARDADRRAPSPNDPSLESPPNSSSAPPPSISPSSSPLASSSTADEDDADDEPSSLFDSLSRSSTPCPSPCLPTIFCSFEDSSIPILEVDSFSLLALLSEEGAAMVNSSNLLKDVRDKTKKQLAWL
jgi:hypothetical protein